MGLQLRLKHALGEGLVEVEARPKNRANVVGRSSKAEVEVPSFDVANAHCFLFVEQGRWVVEDVGNSTGTFVNGKAAVGPTLLESGDTIRLGNGSGAPTLVVDPHHAGVTEGFEEGLAAGAGAAPTGTREAAPWRAPVMPNMPAPTLPPPTLRQPTMPAAYSRPAGYGGPGLPPIAPEAETPDEWANITTAKKFYVPKARHSSAGTIAVFAVLSLLLVAGGGYWLYTVYQARSKTPPEIVVITPKAPMQPSSMFDFNKEAKARAATRAATQSVTRVRPGPAEGMTDAAQPPQDARKDDPEWRIIEQARYDDPVLAIVKFNDYLERFPETPFKADLVKYTDEALDRIWWQRLIELFQERDGARREIADRKVQISQSQDAEFKKGIEAEIPKFAEVRDRADETIRRQMKFAGEAPPNLYDSQELEINRRARDAAYYTTWKEQVISTIKHSRGQRLPWRSSR